MNRIPKNTAHSTEFADRLEIAKTFHYWRKKLANPMITIGWRKIKYSPRTETRQLIINSALEALNQLVKENGFCALTEKVFWTQVGPNALMTTNCPSATTIKKWTIAIEDHHPLGALMDINVIDINGMSISRRETNITPRTCMVCHQDIYTCRRENQHTEQEYLAAINEIILRERFGFATWDR